MFNTDNKFMQLSVEKYLKKHNKIKRYN